MALHAKFPSDFIVAFSAPLRGHRSRCSQEYANKYYRYEDVTQIWVA